MPLSYSYGVVVERIGISDSIDATLAYNGAEVVTNSCNRACNFSVHAICQDGCRSTRLDFMNACAIKSVFTTVYLPTILCDKDRNFILNSSCEHNTTM